MGPVAAGVLKIVAPLVAAHVVGKLAPIAANAISANSSGGTLPTVASGALNTLGGVGQGISNTAKGIFPFILGLLGKSTQAAGVAAGAGLNAIGNIPAAMFRTPASKTEIYGYTPMDAVGPIASGLGNAAGVGTSALLGALGSTLDDGANAMRIHQIQGGLADRYSTYTQMVRDAGITDPSQLRLIEQMIRTMGQQR